MYISLWIYLFCLWGKGWESYLVQIIIATLILEGLLLHSRNQINLMTLICNFILQFCVLREENYEKKTARRIPVKNVFPQILSDLTVCLHCVEF